MKTYKQLLLGAVCSVFFLGVSNSLAETNDKDGSEFMSNIASGENVVLFKIHDVKPIKNDEGIATDCEFSFTLYNRSPKNIDDVKMELSWLDDGVSSVIDEEDEKSVEETVDEDYEGYLNAERIKTEKPKTENFVSRNLKTSLVLPLIKPFRQISLKSKIKTDRCFLLLKDASFSFDTCSVSEDKTDASSRRGAFHSNVSVSNACVGLFKFVSPRDPEYYREFQKVSFNEEAIKREEAMKKDIDGLKKDYDSMVSTLDEVSSVLNIIGGSGW